jgi:hypothetical protein
MGSWRVREGRGCRVGYVVMACACVLRCARIHFSQYCYPTCIPAIALLYQADRSYRVPSPCHTHCVHKYRCGRIYGMAPR